jgi:hypothetical protein
MTLPPKQQLAQLTKAKAEAKRELWEIEVLLAERDMFEQDLALAFNWPKHMPVTKAGSGRKGRPAKGGTRRRPSKWKNRHGFEFVAEILVIRARDKCSAAAAIRELKKADPKKWPESQRSLERRFQEANKYWGWWARRGIELTERVLAMEAKIEARSTL